MKNLIVLLLLSLLIYSCEKDDISSEKTEAATSAYLPMSVGNYWVFEIYHADIDGIEHSLGELDSLIITKDTLINGEKYFRFDQFINVQSHPNLNETSYYRDSARHMISSSGKVLFSENNFTDTIFYKTELSQEDTIYTLTSKMEKINADISMPAGTFSNVLNFRSTISINPEFTIAENPRYTDIYFAENIGKIFESQTYIYGGGYIYKKLKRYKINN